MMKTQTRFPDSLVVVPARKGSKGIPGKNTRRISGKPLVQYTLEYAKSLFLPEQICISTDDDEVIKIGQHLDLPIYFKRPSLLASDTATTQSVLLHALEFFKEKKYLNFKKVILLQPTSPFRKKQHLVEAMNLYRPELDMVVSVKESKANPYFTLFEINREGYLTKSKSAEFTRRQDCPKAYEFNGSIYVINKSSLYSKGMLGFSKIIPYVMSKEYSIDIDDEIDWSLAQLIAEKRHFD